MNWSPFLPERGGHAGSSIKLKKVTVAQPVQHRATFNSSDGNSRWVDYSPLLHTVAREVSNDVCLDCLCRRDVGTAGGALLFLSLASPRP
jgi:hypothetical protein